VPAGLVKAGRVRRLIARHSISAEIRTAHDATGGVGEAADECAQIKPIVAARSSAIFSRRLSEWCDGGTGREGSRLINRFHR
jgi:hypothetical protein